MATLKSRGWNKLHLSLDFQSVFWFYIKCFWSFRLKMPILLAVCLTFVLPCCTFKRLFQPLEVCFCSVDTDTDTDIMSPVFCSLCLNCRQWIDNNRRYKHVDLYEDFLHPTGDILDFCCSPQLTAVQIRISLCRKNGTS